MPPPPPSSNKLQVVALISGGKDSFLSLLHCLAQGHNVIALANLHPSAVAPASSSSFSSIDQPTDLNSHMYQTAGHSLIPLYSDALSHTLYRAPITGTALSKAKDYAFPPSSTTPTFQETDAATAPASSPAGEEDETENLTRLLKIILHHHPTATALSSGAILSTYQRTRVESVCLRLNLIPLAYLWQYPILPCPLSQNPAIALLEDGAQVGLDARIVKVASGGLDEGFLWESLKEERVRRKVERAVGRFGGSALGEGGEYETVVVRGPRGVWRGRIEVAEDERVVRKGEGGEAWLEFKNARVVKGRGEEVGGQKEEEEDGSWMKRLRIPGLWDERFEKVLREPDVDVEGASVEAPSMSGISSWQTSTKTVDHGHTFSIQNLVSPEPYSSVTDQMLAINSNLRKLLEERNAGPNDILFTTILLRSMSDFAAINAIYGHLFNAPNPPARVTVACGNRLPTGADILISVLLAQDHDQNQLKGLHVQSRSYWAPANIGPYSQAISVREGQQGDSEGIRIVHIAGQIPLVPATMETLAGIDGDTPEELFRTQALLSLQHLWRIGVEMDVSWWGGAVAFIAGKDITDPDQISRKAQIAYHLWRRLHKTPTAKESEDDENKESSGPDIWDLKYGGMGTFVGNENEKKPLPDFASVAYKCDTSSDADLDAGKPEYLTPGFFAVEVSELPRGCGIEWQAAGYVGNKHELSETGSHENLDNNVTNNNTTLEWISTTSIVYAESPLNHNEKFTPEATDNFHKATNRNSKKINSTVTNFLSIPTNALADEHRSFTIQNFRSSFLVDQITCESTLVITVHTPFPDAFVGLPVVIVPCERVWGVVEGRLARIGAGIVVRASVPAVCV